MHGGKRRPIMREIARIVAVKRKKNDAIVWNDWKRSQQRTQKHSQEKQQLQPHTTTATTTSNERVNWNIEEASSSAISK